MTILSPEAEAAVANILATFPDKERNGVVSDAVRSFEAILVERGKLAELSTIPDASGPDVKGVVMIELDEDGLKALYALQQELGLDQDQVGAEAIQCFYALMFLNKLPDTSTYTAELHYALSQTAQRAHMLGCPPTIESFQDCRYNDCVRVTEIVTSTPSGAREE